ncbi:MAG: hypothetical protein OQK12_15080 [Motiliproteus sp.]|nr:hypothetical protein [Motiliproteus sp.]MCW9051316.1 hypothetical protein [Motiliproteus sp.]
MKVIPIYKQIPVVLQGLYLINLLALPVLALIPIIYLCKKHWKSEDLVILCHTRQVIATTLWFTVVVVGGGLMFWFLGEHSPELWTVLIMYLIVFHTTFVMIGLIGLAKAITGKTYQPYLIGVPFKPSKYTHLDV